MRKALRISGLIATIVLLAATSAPQDATMVGRQAPDFTLEGLSGYKVRLSDYKGKVILLDFWATWCTPCQTEVPRFISLQNAYGRQGLQIIGISMDDSLTPVRKFQSRFKMNYPVAIGTAKVATAYGGVLGLPMAFLIGRDGRIVKEYNSDSDPDTMEEEIRSVLK